MDKPKAIFITTPSGPNFYKNLFTGEVEVKVSSFEILSESNDLPMPVFGEQEYPEEEKTGLYYVVKDKLDKLQKAMNYPIDITNQGDGSMIEGILIKFDRSNKISGEDMKICNELWKMYRGKR